MEEQDGMSVFKDRKELGEQSSPNGSSVTVGVGVRLRMEAASSRGATYHLQCVWLRRIIILKKLLVILSGRSHALHLTVVPAIVYLTATRTGTY